MASRKNNNLCPVISYIATRIILDPRVRFFRTVLQHDEKHTYRSTAVEEKVKERLKTLHQKGPEVYRGLNNQKSSRLEHLI